jgi:hypothetical protein
MQPALIGTRLESLHGQEVEIKVYGPGQAHECGEDHDIRPCRLCQRLSVYDPDRRGIRLKEIERRWPVALGITEGYHEPISGSMEYLSPSCVFKCLTQPRLTQADIKAEAKKKAEAKAESDFRWANRNARARLDQKRAANPTWTPAARAARSAYLKRLARERAEMDRENKRLYVERRAEKAAYQLRVDKAKVPCSANQCEMGDWIQLDWRQFHDLMGRKATTLETRAVRGCAHCPRIESKLAPHFGAL